MDSVTTKHGGIMTFQEAKNKLQEIAKGEYNSMQYTLSCWGDRAIPPEQTCGVYIHGYNWQIDKTWELALAGMEKQIIDDKISEQAPVDEIKPEVTNG
jgi:hypothetical protein